MFEQVHDLAIIGGGLIGAAIARDAAGRGLTTFLCEQGDIGGASSSATDTIALHDRRDLLGLEGAALSAAKAYSQAKVTPQDIDLFELHDAFSIMSVLSLEACGFAERGRGVRLGTEGDIAIGGQIPITTMGGLKARGHPVGATGVYQVLEVALQLRGQAGGNQVLDARLGMAQNIGGSGATVVTTILEAVE